MLSNMIDTFQIRYDAIPYAVYEHIPLFINVMNEINKPRREQYKETVYVPACKEEKAMNRQKGRGMVDDGRCPWNSIVWHWKAEDMSEYHRGRADNTC